MPEFEFTAVPSEETLRLLVERGDLELVDGRWQLTESGRRRFEEENQGWGEVTIEVAE